MAASAAAARPGDGVSGAGAGAAGLYTDPNSLISMEVRQQFEALVGTRPRIVLGSQSTSRRAIMDELAAEYGFTYCTEVAGIDEEAIRHEDPKQLVMLLAHAKADAILEKMNSGSGSSGGGGGDGGGGDGEGVGQKAQQQQGFLITCDQVVLCGGKMREKPIDLQEARRFIASYNELPACTCGSVVVTDLATGQRFGDVDSAEVQFRGIPDDVIQALLDEGEIMWCSGGLMVEHPIVEPYLVGARGTQDSIMGLPKHKVVSLLAEAAAARH